MSVPTLDILVAGDPGKAKQNFINSILHHHPPAAEIHRKGVAIHFIYEARDDQRIQIHDVSKEERIDRDYCKKMDVIVFCYDAHDPESLQSLEKWFGLLRRRIRKKKTHSFLVADFSNVSFPGNVSRWLAEEANRLKETYSIKGLLKCAFENKKKSSVAFQHILCAVQPKLKERSPKSSKEVAESSKTYFVKKYLTRSPKKCFNKKAKDSEKLDLFTRPCLKEAIFL